MTWLGKILTIVVFVMALAWLSLTAATFATRTNWKASSDKYKQLLEESEAQRKREYDAAQAKISDLNSQLAEARRSSETSADRNAQLSGALDLNARDYNLLNARIEKGDVLAVELAANLKAAQVELDAVRKRSAGLEDERKDLLISLNLARNTQAAAEADARQARSREEDSNKQNDYLRQLVNELRQRGGGGFAGPGETGPFGPNSPTVPEGARGSVTAYSDGLVVLSIGLDAGLTPGAELQVSRLSGGGRYIGTVVVTDVRPKMAVARFKPPFPKQMNQLKPDELPAVGDRVEKTPSATGLK
ncbi:MAG: hypothetical protein K2P78_11765 [Gemmataceae bacterium]|nr:hypothetical protein [Gemmataceae bacterium]